MAQGIADPEPNPARARGERALIDDPDGVLKALKTNQPLQDVAKALGIFTDKDKAEEAIVTGMSKDQQQAIRAAVIAALEAKTRPEYQCDIDDPAAHVAAKRKVSVTPSGKTISVNAV